LAWSSLMRCPAVSGFDLRPALSVFAWCEAVVRSRRF
jgi:hypothetical protein